jgi:23S rRNA pseudouridine1911/1915/1917 synthase
MMQNAEVKVAGQNLNSGNQGKSRQLLVEECGTRLDKYISEKYPDISRTRAQRLIADGMIKLNGRTAKASLKVQAGDAVDVILPLPIPVSSSLKPEPIPLNIIYEDQDLIVVDKPAGLTVHPAPGHYNHTLVNAILAHVPEVEGGEVHRPGIVHRLDKDTSGLIIVAKNEAAHMKLAEQFKNRIVTKVYLALVQGVLSPEEGIIEASIGRHPRHRQRMAVTAGGREARTDYKVVRHIQHYSLLEIRPRTGRTHQIRVHLAAIGFPVVGDSLYGVKSLYLSRQFLHACKLGFRLPSTEEYVEFKSDLPQDLADALQNISSSQA